MTFSAICSRIPSTCSRSLFNHSIASLESVLALRLSWISASSRASPVAGNMLRDVPSSYVRDPAGQPRPFTVERVEMLAEVAGKIGVLAVLVGPGSLSASCRVPLRGRGERHRFQ